MKVWGAIVVLALVGCRPTSTADAGPPAPDAAVDDDAGSLDAGRRRFDAGHDEAFRFTDVTAPGWCSAMVLGLCQRDLRCLRVSDAGITECLARRATACDQLAVDRGTNEGRLRFERDAGLACLNALGLGSCEALAPACSDVLVGLTVPDGGCLLEEECAKDVGYCDVYDNRCPHHCQRWVEPGAECDTFRRLCNPAGFACAPGDGGIDVCQPAKRSGDACTDFYECGEGMYCISNRCVRWQARGGEACGVTTYPYCEAEHFCRKVSDGGVCQRLSGVGGACGQSGGCLPSLRCSTVVTTGVCLPRGRLGQPCIAYNDCEDGLFCSSTSLACEALPTADAGGDCSSRGSFYRCAVGAFCNYVSDVCEAKQPAGASCNSSQQCLSNECLYGRLPDAGYGGQCIASCVERADGGF